MDNINNLRQCIMRYYTVGNSLTSIVTSHFFRWRAALFGLQRSNLRRNYRSALEWGWPSSKFSFWEVCHRIYFRKSRLRVTIKLNFWLYIQRYTSPNENFEYSYPLTNQTVQMHKMIYSFDTHATPSCLLVQRPKYNILIWSFIDYMRFLSHLLIAGAI